MKTVKGDPVELHFGNDHTLIFMPDDDDQQLLNVENALVASQSNAPPDGKAAGRLSVTVTDQNGRPVPGVRVRFQVKAGRPTGNWRTKNGMMSLYRSGGGSASKAGSLIDQGVIRLLGTLSNSSAVSNSQGIASVEYRTSHIGSDFSQSAMAREIVTATLPNGRTRSISIDIGWRGLQVISPVSGGLRVVGAKGKHVVPDLRSFLSSLGNRIKQAKWPHPLTVTAASLKFGGQYPPHFTHKHGATLDLRPMSTDGNPTWAKQDGSSKSNYDFERTKAIINVLKQSGGKVKFNGKDAGGTVLAGHDNHIHVSWLSSISLYSKADFEDAL